METCTYPSADPHSEIHTVRPDGTGARRSGASRGSPRTTADGRRLAYIFHPVRTGTVSQVRIVRRDGSGRRVVDLPRRLDNPIYVHWGS